MIRNAVIHIANEQPIVVDLFERPSPADLTLICTNVRTLDGRRPVFIDDGASVFVFPLSHIRFVEIPNAAETSLVPLSGGAAAAGAGESEPELDIEPEIDEDFLRRVREI